jgi:hypothetical protein
MAAHSMLQDEWLPYCVKQLVKALHGIHCTIYQPDFLTVSKKQLFEKNRQNSIFHGSGDDVYSGPLSVRRLSQSSICHQTQSFGSRGVLVEILTGFRVSSKDGVFS